MKLAALPILLGAPTAATAFVVRSPTTTNRVKTTALNLEDWVADLIDTELWREQHIKDFESEWMAKNRGAVLTSLNSMESGSSVLLGEPEVDFRQQARDRKLAASNPQQYCADRCVSTGNCEVYED
jgi:hypothetical protein